MANVKRFSYSYTNTKTRFVLISICDEYRVSCIAYHLDTPTYVIVVQYSTV